MTVRKRRRWPWVMVFLLLLVGAGIATLPAQVVWRFLLSGRLREVQLDGLTGSIWNGAATDLRIRGVSVGAIDWRLDAMSLAHGAPVLDVHLAGPMVEARGQLQRFPGAALELRQLNANLDAQWLGPLLALPALTPQGRVVLTVPSLKVDADGVPASGQLSLNWTAAAFTGMAQAPIGDVQVQARGEGRRWLGTVAAAPGGPLAIDGGFSLVERVFNADIRLAALDPNHPVVRVLPLIGQTQADGSQRLLLQGELLPLAAPGAAP